MSRVKELINKLRQLPPTYQVDDYRFQAAFHLGPDDYAAKSKFLGIKWSSLHQLAKSYEDLTAKDLLCLLRSVFNEERLLALLILIRQYQAGNKVAKNRTFKFYLKHRKYLDNWNLIDWSAHWIVGAHLIAGDRSLLFTLAEDQSLWTRRIALVSTWYFIRHNDVSTTFQLAELLMLDKEILVQKAVRWMMREAGKKDHGALIAFLEKHKLRMPRLILSYVVAHFPEQLRKYYMATPNPKKSLVNSVQ